MQKFVVGIGHHESTGLDEKFASSKDFIRLAKWFYVNHKRTNWGGARRTKSFTSVEALKRAVWNVFNIRPFWVHLHHDLNTHAFGHWVIFFRQEGHLPLPQVRKFPYAHDDNFIKLNGIKAWKCSFVNLFRIYLFILIWRLWSPCFFLILLNESYCLKQKG